MLCRPCQKLVVTFLLVCVALAASLGQQIGGQTSEVRSRKSKIGGQKSEIGSPRSEVGVQKAAALAEYRVTRWTAENGLPQNTIKALIQTRDGYIWLGTLNGLVRFDGWKFKVFDHSNTPEMERDAIDEIVEASGDGGLWIKAADDVLRYRDHRFERFGAREGFPKTMAGPLRSGGEGRIWCAPSDGEVGLIRDGRLFVKRFGREELANRVTQLEEETASRVLLLVHGALFRFDWESGSTIPLKMPANSVSYFSFFRDEDRALWLCGYDGIWTGDGTNWTQIVPAGARLGPWPKNISRSNDGQLWARTGGDRQDSQLLRLVQDRMEPFSPPELPAALRITQFCEDREGNIWLGTKVGLFRLAPRRVKVYSQKEGLANDDVLAVTGGPEGTVWVGTSAGVSTIREGQVTSLPPGWRKRQWEPVATFLADQQNRLWLATEETILTRYADGKWEYPELLPGMETAAFLKTFYEDREGRIWISTGSAVFCDDHTHCTSYTTNNGLSNGDVRVIYQDRREDMWFGTFGGGLNWLHEGKITCFKTTRGNLNNRAWWIHEDEDGVFWVGSEDGLNRFVPPGVESGKQKLEGRKEKGEKRKRKDQSLLTSAATTESDGRFFTFTTEYGLTDNVINNIQEDDYGYLWLSGLRGIYRVSRRELNEVAAGRQSEIQCTTYGEADGMLSSECNGGDNQPSGCKDANGHIWFPTAQGVAEIEPKEMLRTETPPQVVIEQVKANGVVVFGDGILKTEFRSPNSKIRTRIPPGHARVLEIRYTANSFTAPERVRFKYKLEGYEPDWIRDDQNRRVAFYTNLRPGPYTFHVAACNPHGYWNEAGQQFAFYVTPFFWETWTFYSASGVCALACAFGLHHRRVRGLHRIQRLEQQRAVQEERSRIAHDLHDDLGANLTGVALQLDVVCGERELSDGVQRQLGKIAGTTRGLVDNMREVVWAMNPEYDNTESLASFVGQYAENYLLMAGLRCRLEFPLQAEGRPLNSHTRHQLFLVVKEALHNVVRHARATEVQLRLRQAKNEIQLVVADDGCGLPPEGGRLREHGLDNMKKRVTELGGAFALKSAPQKGTEICIRLPLDGNNSNYS